LIQIPYHLIDAIFYFAAFAVPIYFIVKSRNEKIGSDLLVKLMMLLGSSVTEFIIFIISSSARAAVIAFFIF